jgi:hypothetical protein
MLSLCRRGNNHGIDSLEFSKQNVLISRKYIHRKYGKYGKCIALKCIISLVIGIDLMN